MRMIRCVGTLAVPLLATALSGQPTVGPMEIGESGWLAPGSDVIARDRKSLAPDALPERAEVWPRHPDHPDRVRLTWEPPNTGAMAERGITPRMVALVRNALDHWSASVNGAPAGAEPRVEVETYEAQRLGFKFRHTQLLPKKEVTVALGNGMSEVRLEVPTPFEAIQEWRPNSDEFCTEHYMSVVHAQIHDTRATARWEREFRGVIDVRQSSISEDVEDALRATHVAIIVGFECGEVLPADNYARPVLITELGTWDRAPREYFTAALRIHAADICAATLGHDIKNSAIYLRPESHPDGPCTRRQVRHLIGHVLGLSDEHRRADRDDWIRVRWEDIPPARHSHHESGKAATHLRPYDYASIMHPADISALGSLPPGIPLGGDSVSPGDIAAFDALHQFPWRGLMLSTQPPGGTLVLEGEPIQTPAMVMLPELNGTVTLEWPDRPYGDALPDGTRHLFTRWSTGELSPQIRVEIDAETRWIGAAARVEHQVSVRSANSLRGRAAISPALVGGWFLHGAWASATATPATGGYRFDTWLDSLEVSPDHRIPGHSPVRWRVTQPLGLVAQWTLAAQPHVLIAGRREIPDAEPRSEPALGVHFDIEHSTGSGWSRTRAPVALEADADAQLAVRWAGNPNPEIGRRLLFQHWSDGMGAEEREVEAPMRGGATLDAVFREECLLQMEMGLGGKGVLEPLGRNDAAIRVRALWEGAEDRHLWRLVGSPGGTEWLPCGSEVIAEALMPEDAGLAFSHWQGMLESVEPVVALRLEHGVRLSAVYTEGDALPTREALDERTRMAPVLASPAGLSFSGIAGDGGIPAQTVRFRGRGEMTTVACAAAMPASAVRLDPPTFSVSAADEASLRVEVSGEALPAGAHPFWISCHVGTEEPLRIPVAWTLAGE